jgi:hypothetical protein
MRLLNAGPAAPHPPLCTHIKKANPTDIDPQTSSRDGFNIFLQMLACNKHFFVFSETGDGPMPTEHCRNAGTNDQTFVSKTRAERRGFQPRCYLDPLFSNKSWTLIYHAFFEMCNKAFSSSLKIGMQYPRYGECLTLHKRPRVV